MRPCTSPCTYVCMRLYRLSVLFIYSILFRFHNDIDHIADKSPHISPNSTTLSYYVYRFTPHLQ